MKEKVNGWVVATYHHGFTGRQFMVSSSFATTRSRSIQKFINGSGMSWKYWYRKFNYRCFKAISIITVLPGKENQNAS
jgi:hypothetical protein